MPVRPSWAELVRGLVPSNRASLYEGKHCNGQSCHAFTSFAKFGALFNTESWQERLVTLLVRDRADYLTSRYSERKEGNLELATTLAAAAMSHEATQD